MTTMERGGVTGTWHPSAGPITTRVTECGLFTGMCGSLGDQLAKGLWVQDGGECSQAMGEQWGESGWG